VEYFSSSNEMFGHVAYACLALSYILTNIFWLRVTAVIALFLEIFYFHFSGGDLITGIGWSVLFILINIYQIYWLVRERMSLKLPEAEAPLLRAALAGLDDAQISRILKAANWKDSVPGDVLTRQHQPVDALYFLCSGLVNVGVDGHVVARLERGAFVGEIAYLTRSPATATVVVREPSRILAFSRESLAKVVAADSHINGIIHQMLGRDLAMKMARANARTHEQEQVAVQV
jgi:CRP-like cAMP-binding protein